MYLKSVQRHICILLEWGCSVAQSVRSDTERPASPQPCVIVRPLIRPHICTTLLNNPWSYSSVAFGFGWQKTWYMTFLGGAGQEVFYGTVFLLSADIHSWQEQKPAAVYHPSVSPPPPLLSGMNISAVSRQSLTLSDLSGNTINLTSSNVTLKHFPEFATDLMYIRVHRTNSRCPRCPHWALRQRKNPRRL